MFNTDNGETPTKNIGKSVVKAGTAQVGTELFRGWGWGQPLRTSSAVLNIQISKPQIGELGSQEWLDQLEERGSLFQRVGLADAQMRGAHAALLSIHASTTSELDRHAWMTFLLDEEASNAVWDRRTYSHRAYPDSAETAWVNQEKTRNGTYRTATWISSGTPTRKTLIRWSKAEGTPDAGIHDLHHNVQILGTHAYGFDVAIVDELVQCSYQDPAYLLERCSWMSSEVFRDQSAWAEASLLARGSREGKLLYYQTLLTLQKDGHGGRKLYEAAAAIMEDHASSAGQLHTDETI